MLATGVDGAERERCETLLLEGFHVSDPLFERRRRLEACLFEHVNIVEARNIFAEDRNAPNRAGAIDALFVITAKDKIAFVKDLVPAFLLHIVIQIGQ